MEKFATLQGLIDKHQDPIFFQAAFLSKGSITAIKRVLYVRLSIYYIII